MNYYIFSHFTIPEKIRKDIDKTLKRLRVCKKRQYKIVHPKDPNDLFNIYYFAFNSGCRTSREEVRTIIENIFKKYDIEPYIPPFVELPPFDNFLYFNEEMIPDDVKPLFMKYLKSMREVYDLKRKIFDGRQIATYLIIKENSEKTLFKKSGIYCFPKVFYLTHIGIHYKMI